jgi:hypothetical protein
LLVSLFPHRKPGTLSRIGTGRFFGLLNDAPFDSTRSQGNYGSAEARLSKLETRFRGFSATELAYLT